MVTTWKDKSPARSFCGDLGAHLGLGGVPRWVYGWVGCSEEAALPSEPGAGKEGRAKAMEVGGQHRIYTAEGPHSFAEIIPSTIRLQKSNKW